MKTTKRPKKKPPRRGYHHGNLREALVTATLKMIEENGPDSVTVRDAARRAGVSSGAPFRHFPSREALMAAVAAEAQSRFRSEIESATAKVQTDDPLEKFRAIGEAYVAWAMKNPTHFVVISTRRIFDYDQVESLKRDNAQIIDHTDALLEEAKRRGQLRTSDLRLIKLTGRALVYGLARMIVDGHLPRWGVPEGEAKQLAKNAIDFFIEGFSRRKS